VRITKGFKTRVPRVFSQGPAPRFHTTAHPCERCLSGQLNVPPRGLELRRLTQASATRDLSLRRSSSQEKGRPYPAAGGRGSRAVSVL